jgi:putative tryptophan/tyrosine transport system substrate-binding protein
VLLGKYLKRRAFIAGLGRAATWPLVAARLGPAALSAGPVFAEDNTRTIGLLLGGRPEDPLWQSYVAAFIAQLRRLGWDEGRNLRIEYRWAAGDPARMRSGAQELIALAPSAILAGTAPAVLLLKRETQAIPIVFVLVIDAIALGVVDNLSRPGRNITGFTNFEPSMGSKWLALLKEMAPNIRRVGCVLNPELDSGFADVLINAIQSDASSFAVEVSRAPVRSISDIEQIMQSFGAAGGGLITLPSNFNTLNRATIAATATQYRVPIISPFGFFPAAGGLMSYGPDPEEEFRNAGAYMDRIFRGEKPGDLPVQAPTKFKFVINLKTAKALGLAVPPSLLARADEVIE